MERFGEKKQESRMIPEEKRRGESRMIPEERRSKNQGWFQAFSLPTRKMQYEKEYTREKDDGLSWDWSEGHKTEVL